MNKTMSLVLKLLLISAVAALVLALTNNATAPVIQASQEAAFKEAYSVAFPAGKEFKVVEEKVNENINEVIEVTDGSNVLGYVFNGVGKGGYGGDINFIIGVNNEGVVQGFKPITHSETKGYGARMENDEFINGVNEVNISKGVTYGPGNKEKGEIHQISGATRTTNALTNAFQAIAQKISELSDKIETIGEKVVPYYASNYEENFKKTFKGADKFKEVTDDLGQEKLVRIVDAFKGDELLGHILQVKGTGFGGDINFFLATDLNNKVLDFVIASHGETPNYGANIESDIYKNGVIGNVLNSKIKLKPDPKRENDILLISGATTTSMGMQEAFNEAVNGLKAYSKLKAPEYKDLDIAAIAAEENKLNAPAVDYPKFFEGIDSVEPIDGLTNDVVTAVNKAMSGGKEVGYIIDLTSKKQSFHGDLAMGLLVNKDGKVEKVAYYVMNESPGYGEQIASEDYMKSLIGKNLSGNITVTPEGAGESEIQAVSGATFTTNAMQEMFTKAAEVFKGLK